ncbi:MAG: hypothetical protein ACU826_09385 [Gammaproteobacteria bacterium]
MFFYTLAVIFTETSLIKPTGLAVIGIALTCVLYLSAPPPDRAWLSRPQEVVGVSYLYSGWFGEIALWRVFWPFFLILNAGLFASDSLAMRSIISVSSWDTLQLMLMLCSPWWILSVWRTSDNTGLRLWGALARLATLGALLDFVFRIIIRIQYPRIFFNCQETLVNTWSCF